MVNSSLVTAPNFLITSSIELHRVGTFGPLPAVPKRTIAVLLTFVAGLARTSVVYCVPW